MDKFGIRLRYALNVRGMSQSELARRLGLKQQAVQYLCSDQAQRSRYTYEIARELAVSAEWLATGAGHMDQPEGQITVKDEGADIAELRDAGRHVEAMRKLNAMHEESAAFTTRPSNRSDISQANLPTARPVPIISWVQAGDFAEAIDLYEPGDGEGWLSPHKPCSPYTFALRVEGESMIAPHGHRTYPPGTIIFVDPEVKADPNKRVIAKNSEGDVTFKELVKDAGRYYLKPLNPQYETIRVDGEWEIVGVIIGSYFPE